MTPDPPCPTADLYDDHADTLQVLELQLRDFGGVRAAAGRIATVKCHEDNSLVKARLGEPGEGRILVVDGGGSLRFALVGDRLAQRAIDNGWAGIIVNGVIRDSGLIGGMPVLVKALGTIPRKTVKRNEGQSEVPLAFGQVRFEPGHWVAADADGVVVSAEPL